MEEVVDLAKEVRLSEASAERGVCDNILPQLSPMLNRISYQRLRLCIAPAYHQRKDM